MPERFTGKVVFITGAARGQGRSHAVRFAELGADIIAVDVCGPLSSVTNYPPATKDDLDTTVAEVEKTGRRIVACVADVRDEAGLRAALDEGVAELGGLDVVVANAGIASSAPTWELTDLQWQEMIDVNLTGVWRTVKVAVPHLIEQRRGGSIVFTSSIGGAKGIPSFGHYATAKHGLTGLMKTLAIELAPYGVRVNIVSPTNVDTLMIQNPTSWAMFDPQDPEPTREKAAAGFATMQLLPLPWVDPSDVSAAVIFISSEEARYVTGITLPVDGGAAIK